MQSPAFYTPEELARLLKVSEETIRRMCRTQELEARKVGRSWRVPRAEAARLVGSLEALEAIDHLRERTP
ncbi:helix-turn-helix domain-containing protein [Meiothermus sp. CFH 77666]|uniref:helix-turn-helix domain-containing protein n=1 Tax=Meiothermus sp. CFH 77666 TaxID=2817942 RepID=UPI001AA0A6A4|nr:helix-turn-helix domain-containing protein [Meiothermus sp. CFH 77666]MBO1438659.1 helix-turn-helix domain-containing protein [Meiothermus sp. CFH 77666]